MTDTFRKDPSAVLDYQWDWSAWLATEETIVSATVTVPSGIVKDSVTVSPSAVTVWVSGGTAREYYTMTCHITTSAGREDDRVIKLQVENR